MLHEIALKGVFMDMFGVEIEENLFMCKKCYLRVEHFFVWPFITYGYHNIVGINLRYSILIDYSTICLLEI